MLEHEKFVANSYRQAYEYVNKVNDLQMLVIIQECLKEQVDEEYQAQTIAYCLRMAKNNAAAILILDQELGQIKPTGPAGAAGA